MALLTYTSDINVLVAELITLSNRIIVPVKMILGCPQKGYFHNLKVLRTRITNQWNLIFLSYCNDIPTNVRRMHLCYI